VSVVVLVPVLSRPRNVSPLVESFRKSGTVGRLLFIANESDWDELAAIERAKSDLLVVPDALSTWPQKINEGYRCSSEPWMLLGADDIRFRPGWFEATSKLREHGFGVIGTNDLGNPAVLRGEHSTHPLIDRDYADEMGTIDGPGEIVHCGYRHWCCDNEIVETAKARKAWAFCSSAVVEHCHPYWGKAEMDDTYRLGEAHRHEDILLWNERRLRL